MTTAKNNKAPDPQPAERANASVVEQIAQQWDGCQYDAPGEMVDIGAAIRRAGKRLSAELAEQQGVDAHTLWAMAQLAPGEGIEDGVQRIEESLAATGKQQVGEVQGDALDVEWLKERISSIHSTVSLGHQTGAHAYAGEDFGRYLVEAAGDCREIMRALDALAACQPGAQEAVAPKKMERAVALDLLHSVYKHHGWKRSEGESMTARVHAMYDVKLDAGRNRFVATPKHAAPPAHGIDLGSIPDGWSLRTLATCYQLSNGNQVVANLVGPDAERNAQILSTLIHQRGASPGPRISQGTHDPSGVGNG